MYLNVGNDVYLLEIKLFREFFEITMSIKWGRRDCGQGQSVRTNLAVKAHILYALVNIL